MSRRVYRRGTIKLAADWGMRAKRGRRRGAFASQFNSLAIKNKACLVIYAAIIGRDVVRVQENTLLYYSPVRRVRVFDRWKPHIF